MRDALKEQAVAEVMWPQRREHYDRFAGDYARSARLSRLRGDTQQPVVMKALGDVSGKHVLDVGCGDGVWSRLIKRSGAHRVVGVDISAEMIRLAREAEAVDPLGIEYHVRAAQDLEPLGEFDAVVAVFVFLFADTKTQLARMCERIRANLVGGGQLVAIVTSFRELAFFRSGRNYTKYGITFHLPAVLREGDSFRVEMHMETAFSFPSVQWTLDTYSAMLRVNGFRDVVAAPLEPSPEAVGELGEDYWCDLVEHPIWFLLRATAN
jgi:toxoflavin synthase